MTKKDYIKIASALQNVKKKGALYEEQAYKTLDAVISELCTVLSNDNPRFNRKTFIEYIYQ